MRIVAFILLTLFIVACGGDAVYTPKPRMYPRVVWPDKKVEQKEISYCDFTFKAPEYVKIVQDQYFFEDEIVHPCWFDLEVASLKTKLHCSYYPLSSQAELDQLVNDAFKVTSKHNVKANYIDDVLIHRPISKVYGMIFDVDGPVASPMQFYLTDSTNHFFRASLYFNSKVNPDSTDVVLNFLMEDVNTMIGSWEWRK